MFYIASRQVVRGINAHRTLSSSRKRIGTIHRKPGGAVKLYSFRNFVTRSLKIVKKKKITILFYSPFLPPLSSVEKVTSNIFLLGKQLHPLFLSNVEFIHEISYSSELLSRSQFVCPSYSFLSEFRLSEFELIIHHHPRGRIMVVAMRCYLRDKIHAKLRDFPGTVVPLRPQFVREKWWRARL